MFLPSLITAWFILPGLVLGGVLGHGKDTSLPATRRTDTESLPIRIITHNIRYAADPPSEGEEPWSERKQLLLNELLYHTNNQESFLFLQEVLHNQLMDVRSGLNTSVGSSDDEWDYIGVGRDDGEQEGEYAPILYRPTMWKLHDWETVWLSETPDVPSKGWDASSIRIVTIGTFEHRETSKRVLALNTHLDDRGTEARLEGAKLILHQIERYLSEDNSKAEGPYSMVVLAGDFNSEEDGAAYQTLTASNSTLADAQKLVAEEMHYGNENTYTGFADETDSRIDYVLLGPSQDSEGALESTWSIEGYSVQSSEFEDGVLNSDHRAVVVDAELL